MHKRRVAVAAARQSTTEFEQMITSMRERLRSNSARPLADCPRICTGPSYREPSSEIRLLKMLLQELTSSQRYSGCRRAKCELQNRHNAFRGTRKPI
jgi:hypothetical protein